MNEFLPWNGSTLEVTDEMIGWSWLIARDRYVELRLSQGKAYGVLRKYRDNFPLIVEKLRLLFHLPPRGLHVVILKKTKYYLYRVPIQWCFLLQETPLSSFSRTHPWRSEKRFQDRVREVLLFSDFLALKRITESQLLVRDDETVLVNNDQETMLYNRDGYDFSLLSATIVGKWFSGVDIDEMACAFIARVTGEEDPSLSLLQLRRSIEAVLQSVDHTYIWYANLIVERISRRLLKTA